MALSYSFSLKEIIVNTSETQNYSGVCEGMKDLCKFSFTEGLAVVLNLFCPADLAVLWVLPFEVSSL